MDNQTWFKDAKFGMMIHWGLYSILGGEWRGYRMTEIGEWIQSRFRIPTDEYARLAKIFNPIYFDPEEWVQIAKNAGMQYMVMTAKHHDGFCLYHSDADTFNVADATPFQRDVIGETAEACRKYGMKFGVYYSQDLDWHEPNGGGYLEKEPNCGGMSWTNDWDFPNNHAKNYSAYFERKVKPQVRELLTKYGDLCLIWFDTPKTITSEQSGELYEMVKYYQPNCLVNSRIGNGMGDYRSMGDNQIPDQFFWKELVETPATLNNTWGYKSFDNHWKSAERVLTLKNHLNRRGVNYLLNVGPDALGRIPAPAAEILRMVGEISRKI